MPQDTQDFKAKADSIISHVEGELKKLRTGRASVGLLDDVMVEAYGGTMKIVEVANVSAPDATLLVVSPWDKSIIENVQKGIASAGLNVNPIVDGEIIRIPIPPLTEEARKQMVKQVYTKVEDGKVMLRTLRNDVKQDIENQEGTDGISEDDISAELDLLEKAMQQVTQKLESIAKDKEKELLTL